MEIQPASLEGISAQATLTAGKWPGPPHRGGPVPVAMPAAVASRLHLTLGSVLTGAVQGGGPKTSLQVTGLFQPTDPGSPYWALDILPMSGISAPSGDNMFAGGISGPIRFPTTFTARR